MSRSFFLVATTFLSLVSMLCSNLVAAGWETVYTTNFSSNPGWTTNSSGNYYWDSSNSWYHVKNIKGNDTYAYTPVEFSSDRDYQLSYDINLTRCDWAGYVAFGPYDTDMTLWKPACWNVSYHYVTQGKTASLVYYDSVGESYHPGGAQPAPFSLNTWYHNEVTYSSSSSSLSLKVTNRATGQLVGQQTLTGVGTFSGLDRLAFTNIADRYAVGSTAEGYIDNVSVSVSATPPPQQPRSETPPGYRTYGVNVDLVLSKSLTVDVPMSFALQNVPAPLLGLGMLPGGRVTLTSDPQTIPSETRFDSTVACVRAAVGSALDSVLQAITPRTESWSGYRYVGLQVGAIGGLEAEVETETGSDTGRMSVQLGANVGVGLEVDLLTALSITGQYTLNNYPAGLRDYLKRAHVSVPVPYTGFGYSFGASVPFNQPAPEDGSFLVGGTAEFARIGATAEYSVDVRFGEIPHDPSVPTLGMLLSKLFKPVSLTGNLLGKSDTGLVEFLGDNAFRMKTSSPVWSVFQVSAEEQVDELFLDLRFLSEGNAEGLFAVYWNNQHIGSVDERLAGGDAHTYIFDLPQVYGPGTYYVGFRLDSYSATESSVLVGNVFVVPEAGTLSLLAMGGLALIRRRRK